MKTFKAFLKRGVGLTALLSLFAVTVFAQNQSKLSDPEVAHAAVTANQIDIEYAQIAREKSDSKEVLNFAETMINDHKAVIDKASALAKDLGVTPAENALSRQLLADAEKTKETLRSKSGKAFDRAYIRNEIIYHQAVIDAVEGLLIPETENAQLKQLLQSVVPVLKTHLNHARMVQQRLQGQ